MNEVMTAIQTLGYPIVDKNYNHPEGWKFLFSMKQNEYFVFPNEKTGFIPSEIDLLDENNWSKISPNLYRVQKFTTGDYVFRHHLETNVESENALRDITWKRIRSIQDLEGIIKVRINHLGNIVAVGEYQLMIKKTLCFNNPAYLSLRENQLVIKLPEIEKASNLTDDFKKSNEVTRPIEDIGVLVLSHSQITIATATQTTMATNWYQTSNTQCARSTA